MPILVDTHLFRSPTELRARTAEALELGYDTIFTSEVAHDALVNAAGVAAIAPGLQVGTKIAVAFARSPMTLASAAHDLQALTGGRFVLGLGTQVKAHITRRFSMPWSRPVERMSEAIRALHAIWAAWETGEPLRFEGEFTSHTLMTPAFVPEDHGFGRPEVWVAAVGPRMVEAAATVADGVFPHGFWTPAYHREVVEPAIARGLAASGRRRDEFGVSAGGFLATGGTEEAMAAAIDDARSRIAFYGSTPAYRVVLEASGRGALADELHALSVTDDPRRWAAMSALIDDDVLHEFAIVAEPDHVARAVLERHRGTATRVTLEPPVDVSSERWADVIAEVRAG